MAEITVRLLAGDDEERSFFLSREFSSDVTRLNGVVSRAPSAAAAELGKKGDPITLGGAIIIAAVSGSGPLTALVNTIGSYFAPDSRTEVEIQTADGRKVRISSRAFKREELEEKLRQLLDMAKG
jgi:Effector Associated Constant Component 1